MRIFTLLVVLSLGCAPPAAPTTADAPTPSAPQVPTVAALADVSVADVGAMDPAQIVLIDVRTPSEFATGRAPGAVNMPLSTLQDELSQIPAGAEPYIICQSGGRSARATALLAGNGIAAHNVSGGMSAWVSAGLPTE